MHRGRWSVLISLTVLFVLVTGSFGAPVTAQEPAPVATPVETAERVESPPAETRDSHLPAATNTDAVRLEDVSAVVTAAVPSPPAATATAFDPVSTRAEPAAVEVSAEATATVTTEPPHAAAMGNHRFVAVVGSGPTTVSGVCWSYTVNAGGQPGGNLIGPVCDEDGDGEVLLPDVPDGAGCFVATPPAGFFRPDGDYFECGDLAGAGETTLGFLANPTATATITSTPTRTATPTSTATATAVSSPATNEPDAVVLVQNCQVAVDDPSAPGYVQLSSCSPVAGVTLALSQHGAEVGRFTSGADGSFAVTLPDRAPYYLSYLDGNGSDWIPGPIEESRPRYDRMDDFLFQPAPGIDTRWTIVVKTEDGWASGHPPLGSACYEVFDSEDNLVLPEQCDDDGDGTLVFAAKLPPSDRAYEVRLTQAPPGYDLDTGLVLAAGPTTAGFRSIVRVLIDRLHPHINVRTVDAVTGEPVNDFCYDARFQNGGQVADRACSTAAGVTVLEPREFNTTYEIVNFSYAPGFTPSPTRQLVVIGNELETEVVFQAIRTGTDEPSFADLEIALRDGWDRPRFPASVICYDLTRDGGGYVVSNVCASLTTATLRFEDLTTGSYTLTNVSEVPGTDCQPPPAAPIVVGGPDLGTTIHKTLVFTCYGDPPVGCTSSFAFNRAVDLYYGDLIDPVTQQVLATGLMTSESLAGGLALRIAVDPANPDPALFSRATLYTFLSGSQTATDWAVAPDWQSDARAGLLEQFATGGRRFVVQSESQIGLHTYVLNSFVSLVTEQLDLFPGCEDAPPGTAAQVEFALGATVRFVHVTAILAPEIGDPTPSATPSPTATTELPVCEAPLRREVTVYSGALVDLGTGSTLATGLQLTDALPDALVDLIANDQSGVIAGGIGAWAVPGLDAGTWVQQAGESRGARAALVAGFAAAAPRLSVGADVDLGTVDYDLGHVVVTVDESEIPPGCVVGSWGLLYTLQRPAIARVHFVELNATTDSAGPTPTPTVTAGPGSSAPVSQLPATGSGQAGEGYLLRVLLALLAAAIVSHLTTRGRWRSGRAGAEPPA